MYPLKIMIQTLAQTYIFALKRYKMIFDCTLLPFQNNRVTTYQVFFKNEKIFDIFWFYISSIYCNKISKGQFFLMIVYVGV